MILHDEDVRGTRFFRGVWLALLVSSLCLCTRRYNHVGNRTRQLGLKGGLWAALLVSRNAPCISLYAKAIANAITSARLLLIYVKYLR